MSDTYYVLVVADSVPGMLCEVEGWENTLDKAVDLVRKNDPGAAGTDDDIREKLIGDLSWGTFDGNVWVYIMQTE